MKKILFALALVLLLICPVFSLSEVKQVFPFVAQEYVQSLTEGENLCGSTLNGGIKHLFPYTSAVYARADAAEHEDNSFSVSVTGYTPYPDSWKDLTQEERMLKLCTLMTAMSMQKGATYISRTAGYKKRVLLEESYTITDPDDKNSRTDDPVFTRVPDFFTMYAYQKDNRFGGNTFEIEYAFSDNEVLMKIINHTPMKFMGVTCVEEGNLSMYLDAFCTEEGIVISGLATIYNRKPTVSILFYKIDIEESFQRRIMGLKDKFIENILE